MSKRRYIVWTSKGKGQYANPREVWWSGGRQALNDVLHRIGRGEVAFTPAKSKEKFANATDHPALRRGREPVDCDELDDWECPYCKTTYTGGSPMILRGRDICHDCARELYG